MHYLRLLRADTSRYVTNKFRAATVVAADEDTATAADDDVTAAADESNASTDKNCETVEETTQKVAKRAKLSDASDDSNVDEQMQCSSPTKMETC